LASYTVLTVFDGTDALNEPVMSLPVAGRLSFRQIGIVVGISVLLPLAVYSAASGHVLAAWPEPVFYLDVIGAAGGLRVTWDVILALLPVPFGLAVGLPRPKLMPMDAMIAAMISFAVRHTSVPPDASSGPRPGARRRPGRRAGGGSRLAGFARRDGFEEFRGSPKRRSFAVGVSGLGAPKSITVTIYDTHGSPVRNRLARAYVDDMLQGAVTTDADGVMGITYAPQSEGTKRLRIEVEGMGEPAVDVDLDVRVNR